MYVDVLESGTGLLTLKDGTNLPPGCDASLASVLAQCCLQEEDRNATGKEEDEVGDEKGTCGWETGFPLPGTTLLIVHIHLLPLPPHIANQNPRVCGHAKLQGTSVQISGTIAEITKLPNWSFFSLKVSIYTYHGLLPIEHQLLLQIHITCGNSKELIE